MHAACTRHAKCVLMFYLNPRVMLRGRGTVARVRLLVRRVRSRSVRLLVRRARSDSTTGMVCEGHGLLVRWVRSAGTGTVCGCHGHCLCDWCVLLAR